MNTTQARMPKWLKITLSVFGVLFVFALIFGDSSDEEPSPPAAGPTVTVSPAPKVPQPAEYTVTGVTNGNTVALTGTGGTKSARVLGLETPPPTGDSCYRTEAYEWANLMLNGKRVTAVLDPTRQVVVSLVLADGTDYVTQALQTGHAKYLADTALGTASAGLRTAEQAARTGGIGLWAQPCGGVIASAPTSQQPAPQPAPAPAPRPAPAPAPRPAPAQQAAPTSTTTDEPAAAYYKNCDAARAAGVAPLRRGEPGYSSKLDRDNDGVACE